MAGFKSIGEVVNCELEGKTRTYNFRKNMSAGFSSGLWFDTASGSGNPVSKYWFDAPPLIAKAVYQSTDGGIFHGANVSPSKKYIRKISTGSGAGSLPCYFYLLDYLLYYPTIEDSTTDEQVFDNTVTLPRYEDGEGVMAIVVSIAARTGGQSYTIKYTNSQGVSGRISQTTFQSNGTVNGSLISSGAGGGVGVIQYSNPFIGLQDGDTGIRYIESATMNGTDLGLFSIILVKPIAGLCKNNSLAPLEKDFFMNDGILPEIKDDAFLGFIGRSSNGSTLNLYGDLKVIWE